MNCVDVPYPDTNNILNADSDNEDAVDDDGVMDVGEVDVMDVGEDDAVDVDGDKDEVVDVDIDKDDAVDVDTDKNDVVDVDTDKDDALDENTDKDDAVDEDTDKNDAVDVDADKDDAVGVDRNKNYAVNVDIDNANAVDVDKDRNDSVDKNVDTVEEETSASKENVQHQRAKTYTIIPGVRLNSKIFMDNLRYRYYRNSARNNKTYLICENQKNVAAYCPVTAWILTADIRDGAEIFTGPVPHNHLPPDVDIPMVRLRRSIALAGTSPENLLKPIRQIYKQEISLNPEGARNYTPLQSRLSVNRMRRSRRGRPAAVNPTPSTEQAEPLNGPGNISYVSTVQCPSPISVVQYEMPLMVEPAERVGVIYTII